MKKQLLASLLLMGLGFGSLNNQSSYAFSPSDLQKLKSTGSCQNCDLSGADLANINLNKANLNGANLSGANLTNAKIIDSDLRSVNWSGATIQNTNVYGTQIAISSLTQTQNNGLIFKKPEVFVEKPGRLIPSPVSSSPAIQDSFVSLTHGGGYVAKYTLVYFRPQPGVGLLPKVESGTMTVGFNKRFNIPKEAINPIFKVEMVGIGSPVIFEKPITVGKPRCFLIEGTVFNRTYKENSCSSF
jgi:Pentapeptide repeats (8 copies)